MEDRIQEIMEATGLDRPTAERIAEAELAASGPPMRPLAQTSWAPPRPASPPTSSRPGPGSGSAPSRPPAVDGCTCGGAGYFVADVRYGHPDFGRLVPCVCTQVARDARARAAAQEILAQLDRDLGQLRGCTFATFDPERPLLALEGVPEDQQRAALYQAQAMAEAFAEAPRGWIYLWGPVGAGKSHLAAAIAHQVAAQARSVAYVTAGGLLAYLRAGFADGSADRRLLALQGVELLVLDDMGAQRAAAAGSWAAEQLFELLNARYLHERATVITSNLPPDHLDERLFDRVQGMALEVYIPASSYRRIRSTS